MRITERKGYKISDITLGTVQLGIPYGINNKTGMPTFEESSKILKTALDCEICAFDTARAYGKSEEVLGKYFSQDKREKTLITKVQFTDETEANVMESLFLQAEDSRKKLGLDKIPFLMLHNESYAYKYGKEMVRALTELKKSGIVANVGISVSDKSRLDEILASGVYDCIQTPLNLFDNAEIRSGKIKELAKNDIVIFVRSVYLQGLFFKNPDELPAKLSSAAPALRRLSQIAEEENTSVAALALSYIRDAEGVSSLVLGCETPEQLVDSVDKLSAPALKKSVFDELMSLSEEIEPIVIRPWEWNK